MRAADILKLPRAEQSKKLGELELEVLKALAGGLVDEAKTRQLKFQTALANKSFLNQVGKDQLKQQMVNFLKFFPEVQSDRLAIDREFKRQEDRLDAIIEDINNNRLPSYRHWELVHEALFVEADAETSRLRSSRTFLSYAIPKLKNANILRDFLANLKYQLGEAQFKLYINTPLLLAGMDEAITLEDLYLKKQTNLNTVELEVLNKDKDKKNVLVEYLSLGNGKNTVNIGNVNTHIASAHRSADESHVGAFKLMVEANPSLGISADYQEHSSSGEKLPRKIEIKNKGGLDTFVAENLGLLKKDIEELIKADPKELYNIYIRASDKDLLYENLTGEEQEKAERKVKSLLFMANAALRFMNNMINDHKCNSGTYEYKTDDKATCGLTMEEMVAVVNWASKDKGSFRQKSKPEDVLFALIRQIYDMRRGYDIDYGTDKPEEDIFPEDIGRDNNRCHGGCVNSLASALSSIHTAYNVKKIERADIEREIKEIYGKIAEDKVGLIDKERDREMLETWNSTGRVTGEFSRTLQDIFEAKYRKGFEDDYKGYIDDRTFESIIESGLDNVPMPEGLNQAYAIEEMSVESLYFAIMNGNIPILHLDEDKGYESTLNYLDRLKGKGDLITQLVSRALAGKIIEPGVQRVLLHLSRSKLEERYGNKEILRIEDKSILLNDIAGLSEKALKELVEAESLDKISEFSIENDIPELLAFCVLKFKGIFTKERLKATYGYREETILHSAADRDQVEIVKMILEPFSEQDRKELLSFSRDKHGRTPLHWAAYRGKAEVIKVMLEPFSEQNRKEPLSVKDEYGDTPLHNAAHVGNTEVIKVMLEPFSEQNRKELLSFSRDKRGRTPLHIAAYEGHTEVVKVMLEPFSKQNRKELLSFKDENGRTPLHFAAFNHKVEILKVMLEPFSEQERKERLSFTDIYGKTPLHFAADRGQVEILKVMLEPFSGQERKERLSFRDKDGMTPLHFAAFSHKVEIVKTILEPFSEQERKERLSFTDIYGKTPLHWAARMGNTEVVKVMLEPFSEQEKKELLSFRDESGITPLYSAANEGYAGVMRVILEPFSEQDRKELINAKNSDEIPLYMSIKDDSKNKDVKKLLREHGVETSSEIKRLDAFVGGIVRLALSSAALYGLHSFTSFPKNITSSAKICAGIAITGVIIEYFADTVEFSQSYRSI
jgi:ankyrin repeat protein